MSTLCDLPEEMIFRSFLWLEFDHPSLVTLSRVCRQFHRIVRPLVFRHIVLKIKPSGRSSPFQKSLELLERSFNDEPSLRSAVLTFGTLAISHRNWIPTVSLQLLEKFPNLKGLHLSTSYSISAEDPGYRITDIAKLAKLEYISLARPNCVVAHACLLLPQLLRMDFEECDTEVAMLEIENSPYPKEYDAFKDKLLTVRAVRYNGPRPDLAVWNLDAMRKLLQRCPMLEEFVCDRPLAMVPPRLESSMMVDTSFYPERILHSLEPVQATLRKLRLQISSEVPFEIAGPFLDLLGFRVLEDLKIDSICWMARRNSDSSRKEVYQYLPPSIRDLQIDFREWRISAGRKLGAYAPSIFWEKGEILEGSYHEAGRPFPAESRRAWLLQFPNHKLQRFPQLQRLKLIEHWLEQDGNGGSVRERREWVAVDEIADAFDEAQISLNVQIYARESEEGIHSPPTKKLRG